jgi:adenylate kinase family enzyme
LYGLQRANGREQHGRKIMTPTRILVLGASGAGKSTLSRQLGNRLGIPVVHLDALYHNPGWVPVGIELFRARLAAHAVGQAWVMDGNYSSTLDVRLPRAEAVIWLDLPRSVYFPRAIWRAISHVGRDQPDVGPGNRKRLEIAFLRDWVWTYPSRRAATVELMANLPTGVHGIVLTSRHAVAQFVRALPDSLGATNAD